MDTYKTKKAELDARLVRLENAYAALKVQLKRKQEQEARKAVRQEAEKELSATQQMTRTLDDLLVEKVSTAILSSTVSIWTVTGNSMFINLAGSFNGSMMKSAVSTAYPSQKRKSETARPTEKRRQ